MMGNLRSLFQILSITEANDDCHANSQAKLDVIEHDMANINGPKLPPKSKSQVGATKLPPAADYEDSAQPDVQPPPLPPKSDS